MSQTHVGEHSSWRGHFYLPFECGLCARPVKRRSLAYGLVSTPDSLGLEEVTPRFVFPHAGTGSGGTRDGDADSIVRVRDWAVGARYNVEPAPPGRRVECAVVHGDCFDIYKSYAGAETDALQYLWFFSLWRQPWNRSQTDQNMRVLPREGFLCSKVAVSQVLDKLGMVNFANRLPWEIVSNIFDFSRDAMLWRAASAITIALQRRDRDEADHTSMPALEIAAWKRGDALTASVGPSVDTNSVVRFTIDSQGISQIERIERSSQLEPSYSVQDHEYLVAEQEELKSVNVIFKNGRARLALPKDHVGFVTWNMPRPPPKPLRCANLLDTIDHWVNNGTPLARMCGEMMSGSRYQIAYVGGASGITFIFDNNFLAHIHAHTPKFPIAELPHETQVLKQLGGQAMQHFRQLSYVYLPLPPGEKLLAISWSTDKKTHRVRRPGLMAHMKMAGTVFIGYLMPIGSPCLPICEEPDVLFTRLQVSFVSAFGAYSGKPLSEFQYSDEVKRTSGEITFASAEPFKLTAFAKLDDLVRLDLIEHPTNGTLRGLLFYYTDGSQRLVGQYQIGHHSARTYMDPKCLCLRHERQRSPGMLPQSIYATVSPSCEAGHETHTRRYGGACYKLTGFIRAQFDADTISLRFADRDLVLADALEGMQGEPPLVLPF